VSGFPPQADQQTAQQSGFMKLPFKFVWERFPTAIKIDPPQADSMFDVERSMCDVHSFFPSIKPAVVLAAGPPEAEHLTPDT